MRRNVTAIDCLNAVYPKSRQAGFALRLTILALLLIGISFPYKTARAYTNDIQVLAYNVFFLPGIIARWGQAERAEKILAAGFMYGNDIIILNELFHKSASQSLLNGLKPSYPYQTPILGSFDPTWDLSLGKPLRTRINGGVAILSAWPIEEQIEFHFSSLCGSDAFTNKGFVYVRITKNQRHYHIIGTHAQSDDSACSPGEARRIRQAQFKEMRDFIAQRRLPDEDLVLIGGDLNVDRFTDEFASMLETLQVSAPDRFVGAKYSWDPKRNSLTYGQYPKGWEPMHLDYVLVSTQHAQPDFWHNLTLDKLSPRLELGSYYYQDFSDHYPVIGFAYADVSTPTQSERAKAGLYQNVHFRSQSTDKYIGKDSTSSFQLSIAANRTSHSTAFAIDNWYPADQAFCILSGDYVRIKSDSNQYWNWRWLGSGSYGYRLSSEPSSYLRIFAIEAEDRCLQDGDSVYFVDYDQLTFRDYALQRWQEGRWQDHLFLWAKDFADAEIFTLELGQAAQYQDWSAELKFR